MSLPDTSDLPAPAEPLPPYSGTDALCAMCSHTSASTYFRAERHRVMREFNGIIGRHATLTSRLERQCERCDYQWDEALNPPTETEPVRAADVADLVQAFGIACQGYAADLHPQLAERMAGTLLELLIIDVRSDHPAWTATAPARPVLAIPADVDHLTDPAHTATVPMFVDVPENRPQPAMETRLNPIGPVTPVPLHEKPQAPAGPTGFAAPDTGDDA